MLKPTLKLSLKRSVYKNRRVLITSGPTSVAMDDMRVLTNRSTGAMGRLLAQAFAARGADVTLLQGAVTADIKAPQGIKIVPFFFYDELAAALKRELIKKPEIVLHAAAISDFKPLKSFKGKLRSGEKITLELVPTRKLVTGIKALAPQAKLVGFKFESSIAKPGILNKVAPLFKDAKCDLVVANTQKGSAYKAFVISPDGSTTALVSSKQALVSMLMGVMEI
ncbi:MAG: hypothetical protein HQL19_02730 [Candidatus Omnitrophica bacterium]|nr:hypothetical protein [Candidatus Omnitrophota bacterium]